MAILLVVIVGYFIGGYCLYILLVVILGVILNYHNLLMDIGGYYINGYYSLFYYRPLVVILLVAINDYFINGYW